METLVNNDVNQTLQQANKVEVPTEEYNELKALLQERQREKQQKELENKFNEVQNSFKGDETKAKIWEAGFGEALEIDKDLLADEEKYKRALNHFTQKAVNLEKSKIQTQQKEEEVKAAEAEVNNQNSQLYTSEKKAVLDANDQEFMSPDNVQALRKEGAVDKNFGSLLGVLSGASLKKSKWK